MVRTQAVGSDESKFKIDIVPATSSAENSIAVLPFADLSPARDHDYFSDGIAEEILTALAKINGLARCRRADLRFGSKGKRPISPRLQRS